jgi:hypothetical protein
VTTVLATTPVQAGWFAAMMANFFALVVGRTPKQAAQQTRQTRFRFFSGHLRLLQNKKAGPA